MSTNFTSEDILEANNCYNVWCEHVRSLFNQEENREKHSYDYWFEHLTNSSKSDNRYSNGSNAETKTNTYKNLDVNGGLCFQKENVFTSSDVNYDAISKKNITNKNWNSCNVINMEKREYKSGEYPECFLLKMLPTCKKAITDKRSRNCKQVCQSSMKETGGNERELIERSVYNFDNDNDNNRDADDDIYSEALCKKLREETNRLRITTAERNKTWSTDLQKTFVLAFCDPTVEAIEAQLMEEMTELLLTVRRENAAAAELRRQLHHCSIVNEITHFAK